MENHEQKTLQRQKSQKALHTAKDIENEKLKLGFKWVYVERKKAILMSPSDYKAFKRGK